MILKTRYEGKYQTLELNAIETEQLWVSLNLSGVGLSQEERERLIQETWEKQFNHPEYNNYHKHFRRTLGLDYFDYEGELFVDDTENPSTILEMEELVETISEIVCQMPADWQIMLKGFLFEGKSLSDVARELGMHRSSISRRLIKILPVLQEKLKNF